MRVGDYETIREIGRGGVGAVFEARARDGKTVAVKLLRAGATEATKARFEREQRLHAELGESKGFVPFIDAGDSAAGPYVVMPLLEGGTLRDRLRRGEALPPDEAVALVEALARALGHAHARGLVHRDVKPENVLFTKEGKPLVSDLGLAKHWTDDAPGVSKSFLLTVSGDFLGTVGYASPEQLEDTSKAGPPADVFALGAILYECLTAFPAFTAENAIELIGKVQECRPESVSRMAPRTPAWLAKIVHRALARDPEKRYPDGTALARALARGPGGGRRVGLAAALVLVAVAAVVIIARPRPAAPPEASPEVELDPVPPWFGGALELSCRARNATRAHFMLLESDESVATAVVSEVVQGVARARVEPRGALRSLLARVEVEDGKGGSARAEEAVSLLPRAYEEVARGSTLRLRQALGDPAFMHAGDVLRLAITSDEGVAALDTWGDVRVWDLETGAERRHWSALGAGVLAAAPHEQKLVAPTSTGVAIQDATGAETRIEGRGSTVARWSHDGALVAVGGPRQIRLLSGRGEQVGKIAHDSITTGLAFTPDDHALAAVCADGTFTLWDVARRTRLLTLEGSDMALDVAVSPDGKSAVIAHRNGSLHWVDLEHLVGARVVGRAHVGPVFSIAFAPDGKRLYSAGSDGRVAVWEGNRLMAVWAGSAPIAVARDGRIVSGGVNRIRVLDPTTGEERAPFRGHQATVTGIAPLASGRLVSAGKDGAVIRWSAQGEPTLVGKRDWAIGALAVAPGERTVATANVMKELRLRDLAKGDETACAALTDNVVGLAFDRRGRLFVGLDPGTIEARAFPSLELVGAPVRSSPHGLEAFWTDGARVLAWSRRPALSLGAFTGRPDWSVRTAPGHALAVAPSTRWAALGTEDGLVSVVDLDRGDTLRERRVHERAVRCIAVSPDGESVVTGSTDRTIRVLRADTLVEVAEIPLAPALDVPETLAFAASGRELLVGTMRGMILRFAMAPGREQRRP